MNPARIVGFLVTLSALGETAVGIALVAVPSLVAFLIAAPVDSNGLLVARMMGAAMLALGVTWWIARGDAGRLTHYVAGYLIYNLVVGALFVAAALHASQALVPWVVAIVHLGAGAAFGIAMGMLRKQA
jgi:hypothetical protein